MGPCTRGRDDDGKRRGSEGHVAARVRDGRGRDGDGKGRDRS